MPDNLDSILQRVASGELSPEDAEPLIAGATFSSGAGLGGAPQSGERAQRIVRLQVLEGGKPVVNLRIPVTWAGLAGSVLPGISGQHADRIREAIRSGTVGRILEVQDEDGDGVIISTE